MDSIVNLPSLLYHATIILLYRPYRSRQGHARKKTTAAAEMIDRLFMLHIRRFGFRVITYLESYTMFLASTINILDIKEGVDEEGANARLALGLEVFRNASSTPSNARCVEIIQELLHKNQKNEGAPAQEDPKLPQRSMQLTSAAPNQGYIEAVTNGHSQPFQAPPPLDLPPSHVGLSQSVENSHILEMPETDLPPSFDQVRKGGINPPLGDNMCSQPTVETPLRWLADNINIDHSWMMMEMDLANDLDTYAAPLRNNSIENSDRSLGKDK